MEHCDTLHGTGWQLWYDDTLFPPGTDSFLLSGFPTLRPGLRVCDLGCGTGLLGLLLLRREPTLSITGIEQNEAACRLAERNVAVNGLAGQLTVLQGDLCQRDALPAPGQFDLVISNPPYFPPGGGLSPAGRDRQTAREERRCTAEDVCHAAARLLRWGGRFCLVHRPERLGDLCCAARTAGVEIKRLRLVQKTAVSAPSLMLLEGRRGGRPGLTIAPPLLLQDDRGNPSTEVNGIYFREQEDML